jgi:adenylate kinase family enzyme
MSAIDPKSDNHPMRRVMVNGGPGSGKSTLARALGKSTGLPVFHMDQIHHMPGWVPRLLPEKIKMANAVEAQDTWIFEGGFSDTYENRAANADTIIWIDLPVSLRFWRVLKRLVTSYGKTRPDSAPDCPERIDRDTAAFWKWIWDTRHSHRRRLFRLISEHQHLEVIHLKSRKEVGDFYTQIGQNPRDH